MIYKNLYKDFCSELEDYKPVLEALERDTLLDSSDGMHCYFGLVVMPLIINMVRDNDVSGLKKSFHFFERMANEEDKDIVNVLVTTVLEKIVTTNRKTLEICKKYMGQETLKQCAYIQQFFITPEN